MDCGIRQFRMIPLPQRLLEPPQRIAGPNPCIREQPAQCAVTMQCARNCIVLAGAELRADPVHHLQSRNSESKKLKSEIKVEMRKHLNSKWKFGKQKAEIHFCFLFSAGCFSLVRLIIVVKMAISSEDSSSNGLVNPDSIPHSSRSNSNQSADSSASCNAPPSLETNSSFDRAGDASFSL